MASVKRPTISSKFSFSNLRKKISSSSSSNKVAVEQAVSPKSTVAILPIYKSVDTFVESDSEDDEVVEIAIASVGRTVRLNSQSPLSEIPKTWMEWDKAYAAVSLYCI